VAHEGYNTGSGADSAGVWERQATCDEPCQSEMVETYREIGLEVHLEAFHPDEEAGCTDCMAATPEKFKTIYTRKPG
jgi:hypothetical protein